MKTPRYDLTAAQKAQVQIGKSCANRACELLGSDDVHAARAHVNALFLSLQPADFSDVELMPQTSGPPRFGDVYGKRDKFGVWFIKFEHQGSNTLTVILSCHEAEKPVVLADGRTLRKASP